MTPHLSDADSCRSCVWRFLFLRDRNGRRWTFALAGGVAAAILHHDAQLPHPILVPSMRLDSV